MTEIEMQNEASYRVKPRNRVRCVTSVSLGFTLTELMIVLAIIAILAAMVAPSFDDFIRKNRVKGAAEDVYGMLLQAKSEAIVRDTDIFVNVENGANWCVGYDTVANCVCSGSISCIVPVAGQDVTQVISGTDYRDVTMSAGSDITFSLPRGFPNPTSTLTLSSGNWALNIVTSLRGRIRVCNPNSNAMTGYESC